MNLDKLKTFLKKAHSNMYAAPKEIRIKYRRDPLLPGHKDYEFTDGDWKCRDSYAGWRWPPGKEVVFFQNKPVWCMSYQGRANDDLSKVFVEKVYAFLKRALRENAELPLRGPKEFKEGEFVYSFFIKGDLSYFTGRESITFEGKEVFFQDIMGSLIK